jgi:hypothetical protein
MCLHDVRQSEAIDKWCEIDELIEVFSEHNTHAMPPQEAGDREIQEAPAVETCSHGQTNGQPELPLVRKEGGTSRSLGKTGHARDRHGPARKEIIQMAQNERFAHRPQLRDENSKLNAHRGGS